MTEHLVYRSLWRSPAAPKRECSFLFFIRLSQAIYIFFIELSYKNGQL